MRSASPKIAIVHDWLVGGGAEKVVEQLHELYPEAPIYTSVCSDEWRSKLGDSVKTGYLQLYPFRKLRRFLPVLRLLWFRTLDLSDYDIVISSAGNGEAKFAQATKEGSKHICYCHTPPHFLWDKYDEYYNNPSIKPAWLARIGIKLLASPLRKLDYGAAQKIDKFIANSTHTKNQIKLYYNRESVVVYPPVDISRFLSGASPGTTRHGYITWGRHVPYKRFDIAIEACNELKLPLTIIGEGPDTLRLKKLAGPTITFAGKVSDKDLVDLAHRAKAFIFPSEEDFGIAPVEAIAAGLPVIAYRGGGALDYVIPGETGEFFSPQNTKALTKALQKTNLVDLNSKNILSKFSTDVFKQKINNIEKY